MAAGQDQRVPEAQDRHTTHSLLLSLFSSSEGRVDTRRPGSVAPEARGQTLGPFPSRRGPREPPGAEEGHRGAGLPPIYPPNREDSGLLLPTIEGV